MPSFLTDPNPEVYLKNDYVILDFETTTKGKGLALYADNRVVSVASRCGRDHPKYRDWCGTGEVRYQRASEFELDSLVEIVRGASFVVAHNSKFDLQWLERCGLDLTNVLVYDTLLAEYVLGGNRYRFNQLSLDAITHRRFGDGKLDLIGKLWDVDIPTEEIPEGWLERYCVRDVELTERLFLAQRRDLAELHLLPVLYNRCLLTPVLADIEQNGMQLDENLLRNKFAEIDTEFVRQERDLTLLTGGINLNSGPQMAEFIYGQLGFEERVRRQGGKWVPDRTDSGRPKVDEETILHLKAKTNEQKKFQELYSSYRGAYSELTKYLRKLLACCDEAGGLLHATFNQSATQTHRLSSNGLRYGCQFQNFPRAYKPLFKARHDGWLIGEVDGAQLEFRDAVHLGRDRAGLADIVNNVDIHAVTARVIGVGRQDAKAHTFKPLYGGRSGSPDEVRYYEFFRQKYQGIAGWQQRNIDFVLTNGYLVTEWGLRFYWPGTRMDRSGYVTNSTAICNYPVQSHATAEIIPISLVWFWHRLKRSSLQMVIVNTVHDSIIVELPPEEIEAFHELSKQCLIEDTYATLDALYGCRFTVPLGAGVKVASHWGGSDSPDYVPRAKAHDKGEVKYVADERYWKEAAQEAGMI